MTEPNPNTLTTGISSGVPSVSFSDSRIVLFTREDIEEFRTIVRETCGEDITEQEAWSRATSMVALGRMMLGPIPEDAEKRRHGVQTSDHLVGG